MSYENILNLNHQINLIFVVLSIFIVVLFARKNEILSYLGKMIFALPLFFISNFSLGAIYIYILLILLLRNILREKRYYFYLKILFFISSSLVFTFAMESFYLREGISIEFLKVIFLLLFVSAIIWTVLEKEGNSLWSLIYLGPVIYWYYTNNFISVSFKNELLGILFIILSLLLCLYYMKDRIIESLLVYNIVISVFFFIVLKVESLIIFYKLFINIASLALIIAIKKDFLGSQEIKLSQMQKMLTMFLLLIVVGIIPSADFIFSINLYKNLWINSKYGLVCLFSFINFSIIALILNNISVKINHYPILYYFKQYGVIKSISLCLVLISSFLSPFFIEISEKIK